MTKRTTISIPDDLHEKMERWKSEFNYSRIFQETISQLIESKERIRESASMEEIIERLRKEKKEGEHVYYEEGKEFGANWVKKAHYDEIQLMLETDPETGGNSTDSDDDTWESIEDDLKQQFEYDTKMNFDNDSYSGRWLNSKAEKFFSGWKDAVAEFWEEIKNKI